MRLDLLYIVVLVTFAVYTSGYLPIYAGTVMRNDEP